MIVLRNIPNTPDYMTVKINWRFELFFYIMVHAFSSQHSSIDFAGLFVACRQKTRTVQQQHLYFLVQESPAGHKFLTWKRRLPYNPSSVDAEKKTRPKMNIE